MKPEQVTRDPEFPRLKDFVLDFTGLAYYADRELAFAERVAGRLRDLEISSCRTYLELLSRPQEMDRLVSRLTIGETYFFRNSHHFAALRQRVLPELLEQNQAHRSLTIWSAGCSNGAEPYSLAILLRRDLAPRLAGWNVHLLASDINPDFLEEARTASYTQWAFRTTSEEVLRECFERRGDRWFLDPRYHRDVELLHHNLVQGPFPPTPKAASCDLIVCRNVLIYFSARVVGQLAEQFQRCLAPGGWLLVGSSEPGPAFFGRFETVPCEGAFLYRKAAVPRAASPPLGRPAPVLPEPPPAVPDLPPGVPDLPPVVPAPPPVVPAPLPARPARASEPLERLRELAGRGAWTEARTLCEHLLSREPLQPEIYVVAALIHEHQGRIRECDESLRRALYLDRNFTVAHYYRGVFLQQTGDRAAAARSFRTVLRLVEGDPERTLRSLEGATPRDLEQLTRYHLKLLEGVPS